MYSLYFNTLGLGAIRGNVVLSRFIFYNNYKSTRCSVSERRMVMPVLRVEHLTKDYGHDRGVFDVSFTVAQGEVFGFLGPNGAGKTTTIRHIMGFLQPQQGQTYVNGLNSWERASDIQQSLGYLPGEIALPESMTGMQFIHWMAELRRMKDLQYMHALTEKFELDPSGPIKRMSLGTKRKLAIITAFMHDPDILVLDEPTSGLDPMMQDVFISFIAAEKARGKTMLLSSHMFAEVEATCDRIAMIRDGRIISSFNIEELYDHASKTFEIQFRSAEQFEQFKHEVVNQNQCDIISMNKASKQVRVKVNDAQINAFIKTIAHYELKFLSEIKLTLEDYFMQFYEQSAYAGREDANP